MASVNEQFELQLALEAKEAQLKKSSEEESNPGVFKDVDGTPYEWDHQRQAWFPKIDDDFIAKYQESYGVNQPDVSTSEVKNKEDDLTSIPESDGKKRKLEEPSEPTWFEVDDDHNTQVYVSNLPLNITEEEFVAFMLKCGLILKDPDTGKLKIKLYKDSEGNVKGDGLCCYIKVESVDLALQILDGYNLDGKEVSVERAKFTMKGNQYDPSKKPRKKKGKDKEKMKKRIEK